MNRFRVTIRSAMALVLLAGFGFAALRDPSMWWVGGVLNPCRDERRVPAGFGLAN
jgi:hypothetical protein